MLQNRGYMIDKIGLPAMLEQAAEEATEYAQACLKLARIVRDENPTPVKYGEALDNLIEEWTDQITCARELDISAQNDIMEAKQQRFLDRWNAAK